MVEKITGWMGERQSRRGFLARCGKLSLALGLGLAMAGVSRSVLTVGAVCCSGPPPCSGCAAPQCPGGCLVTSSNQCCDSATNTFHDCYTCVCSGVSQPNPCLCDVDSGIPCP